MDITKILNYLYLNNNSNLEINNDSFKDFCKFVNYPCQKLAIHLENETNIEENTVYTIDCKHAIEMTLVFDVKVNNFLFPDISTCKSLQFLSYLSWFDSCTYDFRHHPHLKQIAIYAPLKFLYKYCFKQNKRLELVIFQCFSNPEIIWEPIRGLTNLKTLCLRQCNISEMPKSLPFKHLHTLHLKGNDLVKVPNVIRSLKNLVELDISYNKIQHLPFWLRTLKLKNLNIKSNDLKIFPNSLIISMKDLDLINLEKNYFNGLEYTVLPEKVFAKVTILSEVRLINKDQEKNFLKIQNYKLDVPENLLCPISHQIMIDPVCTINGISYDRYHIEKWFQTKNTDPCTGQLVHSKILIPNLIIKDLIAKLLSSM